jgi:septum formation protein
MSVAGEIYLASRSPRRRELLDQLGVRHRLLAPDVNEAALPRESPEDYVRRLAQIKAEVAAMRVSERRMKTLPVLAADTAVVLGKRIMGKPEHPGEAVAMLEQLSGKRHRVLTAVAVVFQGKLAVALSDTQVHFRRLGRAEIESYVATGEPLDKAGAYSLQGEGRKLIHSIEGDYLAAVGLPLRAVAGILNEKGIRPFNDVEGIYRTRNIMNWKSYEV